MLRGAGVAGLLIGFEIDGFSSESRSSGARPARGYDDQAVGEGALVSYLVEEELG